MRRVPLRQARSKPAMTACGHRAPKHLLSILGTLLGVFAGMVFSFYDPSGLMSDLTHLTQYILIVILLYLIPQYVTGLAFKKPSGSRRIYKGMIVIPLSYAATTVLISDPIPLPAEQTALRIIGLIVLSGIATIPSAMSVYVLSFFLYILTGIDTCSLPDATKFGCLIELKNQASGEVLETLVGRSDFFVDRVQQDDGTGYVSAAKDPLRLGVYYKMVNKVIDSTFIVYEVNDEIASGASQRDEVLDFQGEIHGLLESWKSRGKVEEYSFVQGSEIHQALQRVEDELGPRKIGRMPPVHEIKNRVWSYPKNHPAQYSLWLTIASLIIGWFLSRFLK